MKKTNKLLFMVLCIFIIIGFLSTCYGFEIGDLRGNSSNNTQQSLTATGNNILSVITTAGIVVSVVVLIIIGIKYMIGSTEAKAEYKKTLMPYVIGAGLVFAASSIAQIIYELAIQLK